MRQIFLPLVMAGLVLAASPGRAEEGEPLTTVAPDKRYVTVAPGPGEGRSIGSYALRVYGNSNPQFPADDFIMGIVQPRDGVLLRLDWQDVTEDGENELIVVTQSVGSGSYLGATAYRLAAQDVTAVASVKGLDPQADIVAALKKAVPRP